MDGSASAFGWQLLVATGVVSGFCSGLLGIGGGMIVVPALVLLLPLIGIDGPELPKVAMATSLALVVTSDGICGRSLLKDGYRTFQRALALEDYARRFFENDATPGLVITMPGKFESRDKAAEFRRQWTNQFTRQNRWKPAVLDQGGKVQSIPVENNKAQFIETYMQVALQLCRLWRMPPHKIGILDRATFSNIEQQSLEFVTDTLLAWLVAWEQGIKRDLILQPEFFAEHNVAGLLRGDLKARYEGYPPLCRR